MKKRLHLSKVWEFLTTKTGRDDYAKFSFTYAKKNGILKTYNDAMFSSIHAKGSTVNLFVEGELKPKTFRRICFVEFDGHQIYI